MPEEPDNPIDRLLRDYSRARRGTQVPPMHEATRRMLQAEVAQVHGRSVPPRRFSLLWPKVAIALAACVLAVAVIWVNRPADREFSLAKADPASAPSETVLRKDESRSVPLPTAESAEIASALPPPAPSAEKKLTELPRSEPPAAAGATADSAALANLQTELRQAASLPNEEREVLLAQDSSASAAGPQSTRSKTAPAIRNPALAVRATEMTNLGAALRTYFTSSSAASGRAPTPAGTQPILLSFQLEQLGAQLRFIDADGSVYVGTTVSNDLLATNPLVRQLGRFTNLPNSSVQFFDVRGSNRTLAQPVILQGKLIQHTNRVILPDEVATFSSQPSSGPRAASPSSPRRSVVGTALISGTNPVPFQAVSRD